MHIAQPIFQGSPFFIYWRGRVYILNRQGGSNLQDEYSNIGGLHDITYLKSQLDALILLASYNLEEHFDPALHIHHDIAY